MLNKEIPFIRIGLPLCSGIVTGLYFEPGQLFIAISVLFIITGFYISLYFNKFQANIVFGLSLSAALFLCGLIHYTGEKNKITILASSPSEFVCTLSDYAEEKEKTIRIEVELDQMKTENGFVPVNGSMVLYNEKDTNLFRLIPGDVLFIKCRPQEIVNRGNPDEFDYKFYLQNRGIKYSAFTRTGDIRLSPVQTGRDLLHRSLIVRQKIIDMYRERGITGDTLALVAAITLGQKNLLDPEQKEYFMKAGVMHIMAVSGLHAVILSFFIFKMLFFLGGRFNIIRIILTLVILWSFAFVTGLTPSVLRATLMFSFLQAGMLMKRPVNSINSVLASAFVLVMVRPSVIFDAGFQLSYAAVIFIISFYKVLYEKFPISNRMADKVWQMTAVTLVAQAGTLSLTIMLFNQFPVWFIISNIIIVPLSSFLIIIGCLVPLTFPVEFLSGFFASVLGYLTGLTETLTRVVSLLPLSVIQNIGLTKAESILLIITIFLLMAYILYKESFSILVPATSLFLFFMAGTIKVINNNSAGELVVYNSFNSSSIGIKTGNTMILLTDTIPVNSDVLRHCSTRGLKLKAISFSSDPVFIETGGKKILICNSLNDRIIRLTNPETVIFACPHPLIDKQIPVSNPVKNIIISSGVSPGFQLPLKLITEDIDTVHYVKKSGAFIARL